MRAMHLARVTLLGLALSLAGCGATPRARDGRELLGVSIKEESRMCTITADARDVLVEESVAHGLLEWFQAREHYTAPGELRFVYGERGRDGADPTPDPPFVRVWGDGAGVAAYVVSGDGGGRAWCGSSDGGTIRMWPFAAAFQRN